MLHLIQKTPFTTSALKDCLSMANPEDEILLMQDGVYAVMLDTIPPDTVVYALDEDLASRGLQNPNDWVSKASIKVINMSTFVDLTTRHNHTLSWY